MVAVCDRTRLCTMPSRVSRGCSHFLLLSLKLPTRQNMACKFSPRSCGHLRLRSFYTMKPSLSLEVAIWRKGFSQFIKSQQVTLVDHLHHVGWSLACSRLRTSARCTIHPSTQILPSPFDHPNENSTFDNCDCFGRCAWCPDRVQETIHVPSSFTHDTE